jgi:hypothetical protein
MSSNFFGAAPRTATPVDWEYNAGFSNSNETSSRLMNFICELSGLIMPELLISSYVGLGVTLD